MTDLRPLLFNAFVMNTPSHIHHGQWRRPGARPDAFEDLGHWIEVARTLERGVFARSRAAHLRHPAARHRGAFRG